VEGGERPAGEIADQLRDCRACGIVLDTMQSDLITAVGRLNMPAVMMDSWDPRMNLDSVVQDGFQGALLAAQYLAGRGHERIGWLGPIAESTQSRERFGGAVAGIAAAGLKIEPKFLADTPRAEALETAKKMLSRPDRPTGLLALWHECAAELAQAARDLGLMPGRDLDFVGWTPREQYDTVYRALFNGSPLPPTMVWSVAELTRVVVARLAERRANPKQGPILTKIPVKFLPGEETK
jgi:LacI family transcriptional regulator